MCRVVLALALVDGLMGCAGRTTMPEVRGHVVDGRTGRPLVGALVTRELFHPGPFDLVDTRAPEWVAGGDVETVTDADGRFVLPAFTVRGKLTGMYWLVYAPGYFPSTGCYSGDDWPFGGCAGFFTTDVTDPWVRAEVQRGTDRVGLELRLFPPTLEGVTFYAWVPGRDEIEAIRPEDLTRRWPGYPPDPWGEYFRRLNILVQQNRLPVETFVEQALGHLDRGPASADALEQIDRLIGSLGRTTDEGPCFKASLAFALLRARDGACRRTPQLRGCDQNALASFRLFLDRNCADFRR